jgi:hypothetical protein
MAKGEHQVKAPINRFVDPAGSGTITFYIDRPHVKRRKFVPQHLTKSSKIAFEPAEQDKDSVIEDERLKAVIQSPKGKVPPQKASALHCAINPIDDLDDDLTPPPETPHPEIPPPKPRRSGRTAVNVSIAMMTKQGPETYCQAVDEENVEQWKEAIGREVESIESHDVFIFV